MHWKRLKTRAHRLAGFNYFGPAGQPYRTDRLQNIASTALRRVSTATQADVHFMQAALCEARSAERAGEIPIGAVVVSRHRVIARGHNQVEQLSDATAHAEMIALTAACNGLGSKYLSDCTLYVTLEPCCMCSGAMYWTQLGRLVFGARDVHRGYSSVSTALLHPRTEVCSDVLATDSTRILRNFFKGLRI